MTTQLDDYEIAAACDSMRGFLDVLTNWYIRRSRDRFWDSGDALSPSTRAAFDTLWTALEVVTRTVAPLLPLTTEEIWRGLTGGRSVHLQDWPDPSMLPADHALVAGMDRAREVCSTASALRKAGQLRTRLPLSTLTVVTSAPEQVERFVGIVADEVNVKSVELVDVGSAGEAEYGVSRRLTVNARAAGPRLGKDVQSVIRAAKAGEWTAGGDGTMTVAGHELGADEFELTLEARDGAAAAPLHDSSAVVELDVEVTPELAAEGLARDAVRMIQQARKDAGLHVTDRITATLSLNQPSAEAVESHRDWVAEQVLATAMHVEVATGDPAVTVTVSA